MSRIIFRESAAPTTPASGQMTLFADTNGDLSWLDDGGNLTKLVTTGATTITLPNATDTIAVLGTQQTFTARPIFSTTIGVGSATPSTSGSGITFPATQSPSSDANTLDDYEEGTWTPALTGSTGSAGLYSLSTANGRYVKIGQLVYVSAGLVISNKGSWGGDVRISLPTAFNASSSYSSNAPIGSVLLTQHSFTGVPIVGLGNIGASTYLVIPLVTSASVQVNLQWSQLVATSNNFINFSYIYEV